MKVEWVEEIERACRRYGTAFFFKQWGGVNKKRAGRQWRGSTSDEMPRRFPGFMMDATAFFASAIAAGLSFDTAKKSEKSFAPRLVNNGNGSET